MKRIVLLLSLFTIIAFSASAENVEKEFVNKDFRNEALSVSTAQKNIGSYFNTTGTTFKLDKDVTDNEGIRHTVYQQYDGNTKVDHAVLVIHSKNGWVENINGAIKKQNDTSNGSPKKAIAAPTPDAELVYIDVEESGKRVYKLAYKFFQDSDLKYMDASTGDIIRSESMIAYDSTPISKEFTAKSLYSGNVKITCDVVNGNALLQSTTVGNRVSIKNFYPIVALTDYHDIIPHDAGSVDFVFEGKDFTMRSINSVEVTNYNYKEVYNDNTNGKDDKYPDLFVIILGQNGDTLHISDYKNNIDIDGGRHQFPVTFRISSLVDVLKNEICTVKVCSRYNNGTYTVIGEMELKKNVVMDNAKLTYSDNNIEFSCYIANYHPAIDVFYGTQKVLEYYRTVFNYNSFDNNGAFVQAYLHRPSSVSTIQTENEYKTNTKTYTKNFYNNAIAPNYYADVRVGHMFFGIGSNDQNSRVGLNAICHEYTHLVTAYRPVGPIGSTGKSEDGAINESCSDMMAKAIEHYYRPETFTWKYGTEHKTDGTWTRDFEDPSTKGHPDTYGVAPWKADGDQHATAGVMNHWFYLLSDGGSGVNGKGDSYNVEGIGVEDVANIVFHTAVYYQPPYGYFKEFREQTLEVVKTYYPNDVQKLKAVTNAWHAVGLGEQYPEDVTAVSASEDDSLDSNVRKELINGRIYIIKNGERYDLTGKRIEK